MVSCSKCLKIIMGEHHFYWVLCLKTSELRHKINNTLLTILYIDFVIVLASNHVKPLLLFEEFTTSWVLMQDRGYVPLLKMENARYVLAFPHVLAAHTYLTHTIIWEQVAQKSRETRDNSFWGWPQWRWHVLSKSSDSSRISDYMKGLVQPVVQSEAPSHCSAETAIMISLAFCAVTLAA